MIKGGAILYTLVIATLMVLITSFLILHFKFSSVYFETSYYHEQLINKVNNDILLKANNCSYESELPFAEVYSESNLLSWGAYDIVTSKIKWKSFEYAKAALVGSVMNKEISLYLPDNNQALYLAGKTNIKGKCYLPKRGVKRAFIEGQSFSGDKLIDGSVLPSSDHIPKINSELIGRLLLVKENYLKTDSLFEIIEGIIKERSFLDNHLLSYSTSLMKVEGVKLKGNIVLFSDREIHIESNNLLEDILIIAPKVIVKENFIGNLQIVAFDSLVLENKVALKYPSSLICLNDAKTKTTLSVGENCDISGVIIAYNNQSDRFNFPTISIQKESVIKGLIYNSGYTDFKGSLYGSLFTNFLILKTPSSTYTNHFLNAEINPFKLPEGFLSPSALEENTKKEVLKWLN